MTHRATYSPEDNKLRLYPAFRFPKEEYEKVREAGFIWAPRQELFVAPMWTPSREDFLINLCGEIEDEDTSLVDRAEERSERFEDYSEARAEDAERAHKAVSVIANGIPLGQPILIGHHSERHARRDAEKIENGMRKAVKMWETSQYWKDRAAGAIRHAKYKELPSVRARRIKGLEADLRSQERNKEKAAHGLRFWRGEMVFKRAGETLTGVTHRTALLFTGSDSSYMSFKFPLDRYPRKNDKVSKYEGDMDMWSALGGSDGEDAAILTVEQAAALVIPVYERCIRHAERWMSHINNRLAYERAMLAETGGTIADRSKPEVGGGCRCWASPRGGWSYIQKVNKVSVTLLDNWGNGGQNFTRTIPFDKLAGVMSKADIDAARAAGRLTDSSDNTGFFLTAAPEPDADTPDPAPTPAADFDAMRDSLRAGVLRYARFAPRWRQSSIRAATLPHTTRAGR